MPGHRRMWSVVTLHSSAMTCHHDVWYAQTPCGTISLAIPILDAFFNLGNLRQHEETTCDNKADGSAYRAPSEITRQRWSNRPIKTYYQAPG